MNTLPLSVFIIAKNEADRIGRAIASVKGWVDETIVIDSGSTDGTVAIAEKMGARVLHHPFENFVSQKIFGESQCRQPWVLNIDADEEISPALASEIQALFHQGEPSCKAFHLHIVIVHRFDEKIHRFAPENTPVRFYHRNYGSFNNPVNGKCHDSVLPCTGQWPAGSPLTLKHPVFHRCMRSLSHTLAKANFITTEQAAELYEKGKIPSRLKIILAPFFFFFKVYFLRRYCVYGFNGFVDSVIFAFTKFIRLAKARELQQEALFLASEKTSLFSSPSLPGTNGLPLTGTKKRLN